MNDLLFFQFMIGFGYFFPIIATLYIVFRYQLKFIFDFLNKNIKNLGIVLFVSGVLAIPLFNWFIYCSLTDEWNTGLPYKKQEYFGRTGTYNVVDKDAMLINVIHDMIIVSPMFIVVAMFYFL
jgi:hypothetical protein